MDFDLSLISDLMIGGTALAPIIIGIVAILKKVPQFKAEYAPYAAGLLAVLSYGLVEFLQAFPQYMVYAEPVAYSVYLFLVVSGVYQLSKSNK